MLECRYCGNEHDVRDLCRARRVHRRTFLFTASVAAVGAVLPAPPADPRAAYVAGRAMGRAVGVPIAQVIADPRFRERDGWRLIQGRAGVWLGLWRPEGDWSTKL
jgi:hypothetical protein